MSAPLLVVRADASSSVGFGHVMRSMAVAEAWVRRNGRAIFVTVDPPPFIERRLRAASMEMVTVPEGSGIAEAARGLDDRPAWLLIDGYHLGAEQGEGHALGARVAVIDDHGAGAPYDADLLIDQNVLDGTGFEINGTVGEALLGPRYALLRAEFGAGGSPAVTGGRVRGVLVTMGGTARLSDLHRAVETARTALPDATIHVLPAGLRVTAAEFGDDVVVHEASDVLAAMSACDLAIAAAGSTVWELCRCGVVPVLVSLAENQRPVAERLAASGIAFDAGWWSDVEERALARILALGADPGRRTAMAERGRLLVDGRGTERCLTRLRSRLLEMRAATSADTDLLFEWVNDPMVRRSAFVSDTIPFDTHASWFAARLADRDCIILIAHLPGSGAIGQVRFDLTARAFVAEVDVSVARAHRGKGWAAAIIQAGVARLFKESPVTRVEAWVKHDNAPSVASFLAADFDRDDDPTDARSGIAARYVRLR